MKELPNKFVFCPNCGEMLDGVTCVTTEDAIPKEGDISICFVCGTLLEFEEGFFVHELSEQKLNSLKILDEELYDMLIRSQTIIKNKEI